MSKTLNPVDWTFLTAAGLLKVFSYLNPCDIISSIKVCKMWEFYGKDTDAWKPICIRIEAVKFCQFEEGASFYDLYKCWYLKFKTCQKVYPQVLSTVSRFYSWASKVNLPFSLGGMSESIFSKVENDVTSLVRQELNLSFTENYKFELPEDIKCWHLMCSSNQPIMGCYSFYDHEVELSFIPPQFFTSAIRREKLDQWRIPICVSPGGSKIIYIATADHGDFKRGNIFTRYATGQFFLIADSFIAWVTNHILRCESGYYQFYQRRINLYPRIDVPESTTNGVKIQASPLYIPEGSRIIQFPQVLVENLWSYSITITMDSSEPSSSKCKLVSRYWEITSNGHTHVTEGPGVIGLYPDVYPGSFFRYESCCALKASTGTMGGYFVMRKENGETFQAVVPTNIFKVPTVLTLD